eukprot:COSAG02_NODE_35065_length_474_cov_0.944000_1_plen_56_part_10
MGCVWSLREFQRNSIGIHQPDMTGEPKSDIRLISQSFPAGLLRTTVNVTILQNVVV